MGIDIDVTCDKCSGYIEHSNRTADDIACNDCYEKLQEENETLADSIHKLDEQVEELKVIRFVLSEWHNMPEFMREKFRSIVEGYI